MSAHHHTHRRVTLLGLPFDVLTLSQATALIRQAALKRQRCFFSTPNLNFLITAQTDAAFRQSVQSSDLSLADGMPIVWLSRWIGTPLPQRVAGSDIFAALRQPQPGQRPIKVYFFGGLPGVAERAAAQINREGGGMVCVGYASPGFCSVSELSTPQTLARINGSGADLLVVALGAVKGQAWIVQNLAALQVPVVSHLGAVLNFVAKTVRRAPVWMQKAGLEWLWRIGQEPVLWRRYWHDGVALLRLLAPLLLARLSRRGKGEP